MAENSSDVVDYYEPNKVEPPVDEPQEEVKDPLADFEVRTLKEDKPIEVESPEPVIEEKVKKTKIPDAYEIIGVPKDERVAIEDPLADFDVRPPAPDYSGVPREEVAASFDEGEVTAGQAFTSNFPAMGEVWDSNRGWIMKSLITISAAEQAVARQAVNLAENIGMMPTEDAKDLLSRDEVHPSDLVNYYWRDPETWYAKTGRFAAGLAADIFLDPLTYLGPGALLAGAKTVKIGKTTYNTAKMGKSQGQAIRRLSQMQKVLTDTNKLKELHVEKYGDNALFAAENVADHNAVQVEKLGKHIMIHGGVDPKRLKQFGEKIYAPGKKTLLNKKRALTRIGAEDLMKKKSFAQELSDGERGITLGFSIPFTNLAKEIDFPFTQSITRLSGDALLKAGSVSDGLFNALGKLDNKISFGLGNEAVQMFKGLATKTGFPVFDRQQNLYHGGGPFRNSKVNQWLVKAKKIVMPDGVPIEKGLRNNINDEIEKGFNEILKVRSQLPPELQHIKKVANIFKGPRGQVYQVKIEPYNGVFERWAIDPLTGKKERIYSQFQIIATDKKGNLLSRTSFSNVSKAQLIEEGKDPLVREWRADMLHTLDRDGRKGMGSAHAGLQFAKDLGINFRVNKEEMFVPGQNFWRSAERRAKLGKITKLERFLPTPRAIAIEEARPGTMDLIDEMHEKMAYWANEYRKRKIPFTELIPSNETGVVSYLKHMLSEEWFSKWKDTDEALEQFTSFLTSRSGKGRFDSATLGRKLRNSITDINEESYRLHGVKMFVDDPLELIARRVQEMDLVVRNHDLMESAIPYLKKGPRAPGLGWIEFKHDDFRHMATVNKRGEWLQHTPEFYRMAGKKGQKVWVPEQIYDRFFDILSKKEMLSSSSKVLHAFDVYNRIFRNSALFGAGYLGLNMFSNIATYVMAGTRYGVSSLVDATKIIGGFGLENDVIKTATGARYTYQQIIDEAYRRNVLRSGTEVVTNFLDLGESMGSLAHQRKSLGYKTQKLADKVFLWEQSRRLAQVGDDIPKLGIFVDRLKAGFTFDGAAEAAEKYFYNYNNISGRFGKVRQVIPFSTFPVKTAEMVIDEALTGKLNRLSIPAKVNAALEGQFFSDQETRDAMRDITGNYNGLDSVNLGMIAMRDVSLNPLVAKSSLEVFQNPLMNLHPGLQLLAQAGLWRSSEEEIRDGKLMDVVAKQVDMLIPSYLRHAFSLAEINGAIDFGGWFSDRYTPDLPKKKDLLNVDYRVLRTEPHKMNPRIARFDSALQWGKYVNDAMGEDWMFKLFFPELIDPKHLDERTKLALVRRGSYIQKHMRQLSAGLLKITPVDRTFFWQKFAIEKNIKRLTTQLDDELREQGHIIAAKSQKDIFDENVKKKVSEYQRFGQLELRADLHAEKERLKALIDYYDFFYKARGKAKEAGYDDFHVYNWVTGNHGDTYNFEKTPKRNEDLNRSKVREQHLIDMGGEFNPDEALEAPVEDPLSDFEIQK